MLDAHHHTPGGKLRARDATPCWLQRRFPHVLTQPRRFEIPVAAETLDSRLAET